MGDAPVEAQDIEALRGVDVTVTDHSGVGALHVCAAKGWLEGVTMLLQNGADPNLADNTGQTALHSAAQTGTAEVLSALLRAGADVNAQDRDMDDDDDFRGGHYAKKTTNRAALHYAAERLDAGSCKVLLDGGAEVDAKDCWYKTALHLAEEEQVSDEQLKTVQLLIDSKAHPNLGNMERGPNQTSLLAAVYANKVPLLNLLIQNRAEINARGKQGMSALHFAARSRSKPLLVALLAGRADPSSKSDAGATASDLARSNGCPDLCSLLDEAAVSD